MIEWSREQLDAIALIIRDIELPRMKRGEIVYIFASELGLQKDKEAFIRFFTIAGRKEREVNKHGQTISTDGGGTSRTSK